MKSLRVASVEGGIFEGCVQAVESQLLEVRYEVLVADDIEMSVTEEDVWIVLGAPGVAARNESRRMVHVHELSDLHGLC